MNISKLLNPVLDRCTSAVLNSLKHIDFDTTEKHFDIGVHSSYIERLFLNQGHSHHDRHHGSPQNWQSYFIALPTMNFRH